MSPGTAPLPARLVLLVFCPFAAGFFLSFLFRNVTAVIAKDLAGEFALSPAALGLLTSVYFLTFAAMQVPVGVFLDRFGPRRVTASLLVVAAAGAVSFAMAGGFGTLALGRALIGIGVSSCLIGAMKAFSMWFPLERMATLNGMVIAAGGLGGLAATTPAEALAAAWGWRGVFWALAALCLGCAASIAAVVPERPLPGPRERWGEAFRRTWALFERPLFWRIALQLGTVHAGYQALIGLWLAPWLIDVAGLDRPGAARWLFIAALGYTTASLAFGIAADQFAARGISRLALFKAGTFVAIAALAGLALAPAGGLPGLLVLYASAAIASSLSYALLTRHFPADMTGRVNTSLNILQFVFSFVAQWGIGAILRQYPAEAGRYDPRGYAIAFGLLAAVQFAAWLWLATLSREPAPHASR